MKGRVLDPDGKPVAGARVYLSPIFDPITGRPPLDPRPEPRATRTGQEAWTSTACRTKVSSAARSGSQPVVRCSPSAGNIDVLMLATMTVEA